MLSSLSIVPAFYYQNQIKRSKDEKDIALIKQRDIIENQIKKVGKLDLSDEDKEKRLSQLKEILSNVDSKLSNNRKINDIYDEFLSDDIDSEFNFDNNKKLLPFYNENRLIGRNANNNIDKDLNETDSDVVNNVSHKLNLLTENMINQSDELNSFYYDNVENSSSKVDLTNVNTNFVAKSKIDRNLENKLSTYKYFSVSSVDVMLKNNYKPQSAIKILDLSL